MTVKTQKPVGRMIVLTGPSCAGKSPLLSALRRLRPDVAASFEQVVLYNSRAPRPGEVDGVQYHFRPREAIEALRASDDHLVIEARNDLQALSLKALFDVLERPGDALFEGNPYVASAILDAVAARNVDHLGIFVSPLSREEVQALRRSPEADLDAVVVELMRGRLLRRASAQKNDLSDAELADIDTRARSTYRELAMAHRFDRVVVNHDGEDSDHWTVAPQPLGDARRALETVATLLSGRGSGDVEQWDKDVFPLP